jgi:L-lactate dehydrogenase complex protein LldE
MKVELFIPCFIDQVYPDTALSTLKVLKALGCEVSYNPKQTCCGQPAYNAGFWEQANDVGSKFLNDFKADGYIVSPSGSCVGMVKNSYNDLFTNLSANNNKCKSVQNVIYELSDFIVNILKKENVYGAKLEGKAVYHDSCSALRECNIKNEPRLLLSNVDGLELLEMPESETCCGFGGTFSTKFKEISSAMAEQKVLNAISMNVDYIISTDASCLMHLQGYIDKNKLSIKTIHIADVLASGW